jgi:hypothetical protein
MQAIRPCVDGRLVKDPKAKIGTITVVVQQERLAPRGIAKLDVLPRVLPTFRYLSTQRSRTCKLWERFATLGREDFHRVYPR